MGVNVGDVIIEIEGTGVRGLPWSYINSEIVTDAKANIEGKQTRISIVFLRKRELRDEPTEPKQEVPAEDSADAVPPPAISMVTVARSCSGSTASLTWRITAGQQSKAIRTHSHIHSHRQ